MNSTKHIYHSVVHRVKKSQEWSRRKYEPVARESYSAFWVWPFAATSTLWMNLPGPQSHGCFCCTILFMRPTFYYVSGMRNGALHRLAVQSALEFQPTTQPTKSMSCMTSSYFGSPRGLVSCCKTYPCYLDTVEVWGSSPHGPTISFKQLHIRPIFLQPEVQPEVAASLKVGGAFGGF